MKVVYIPRALTCPPLSLMVNGLRESLGYNHPSTIQLYALYRRILNGCVCKFHVVCIQVELAQRSAKAVQSWSATKEIQLKRSRKNKEEEMKKVKEEAKEIEEKKQAAEVASKKWREEKTRQLVGQLRQKKKKELEEIKRKEEENTEKGQCASQAFEVW